MAATSAQKYPVVLRMEGMFPADIGGYEGHRTRRGGDQGHIDKSRSHLNKRLIGHPDWARRTLLDIEKMRLRNHDAELSSLERRGRKSELERRIAEGPRDPWRSTRHGPLREVILTANRKWFEYDDEPTTLFSDQRQKDFERSAKIWLKRRFGSACVHARADHDEEAYHIHAVIVPRTKVTLNGSERDMLQPSMFDMIRSYENAQDDVGRWFAPLGLVRGERRKAAIREALENGEEPPENPRHVRPKSFREKKERELHERDANLKEREDAIGSREAACGARETALAAREKEIGKREEATSAIEAVAIEVLFSEQQETTHGQEHEEIPALSAARRLFEAARQKLKTRAEKEAEENLAKEREAVERATEEIRAADQTLMAIAQLVPIGLRRRIAAARTSLAARIAALGDNSKSPGEKSRETGL